MQFSELDRLDNVQGPPQALDNEFSSSVPAMGDDGPNRHVEEEQPNAVPETGGHAAVMKGCGLKDGPSRSESAFKRFITGPYYEVIPPQYERMANADKHTKKQKGPMRRQDEVDGAINDYLGKIKSLVINPVDVDEHYGLEARELVPLPFDVPKWHGYLMEVLSGVYLVAQATIVMFIAIYVENQERSWKSGGNYTRSWYPLVKALIIIYPLVTLLILVSLTIDYTIRKFMYFRLLSMRILLDWDNHEPWKTWFFYYFVFTWGIMNAWAIYGVAKYYKKDGNTGVDSVSFGTFVVVNLQTIQLFLYYLKLLSTESRLLSLNQIFERAPIEAQQLLEFTYVIREKDLVDECYGFALFMQRAFFRRLINIVTCCFAAKDWHTAEKNARFNIERLKEVATNYQQVERKVRQFRRELLEEEMESSSPKSGEDNRQQSQPVAEATENGTAAEGEASRNPEHIQLEVDGAAVGGTGVRTTPGDGKLRYSDFPPEMSFLGSKWRPLRWAYKHFYASLHSLHVSVMVGFPSWPYRPDTPYFRMLTFIQLLGIFGVGAIVVFGWFYSTSNSNCVKATKTCATCLAVHERYFSSQEPPCLSFEAAVTNIVAATNGTWLDNGVLRDRYCNWACYGNFTPSPSCPAIM